MVYSRSPTTRRPRTRLRKRHTFRGFRKYYNFSTGNDDAIYDRNKVLSSGFTVGETWAVLIKHGLDFAQLKD